MKVVIEVEDEKEIMKIRDVLKGEHITVLKSLKGKEKMLKDIFNEFKIKLPKDFKFDRQKLHAR